MWFQNRNLVHELFKPKLEIVNLTSQLILGKRRKEKYLEDLSTKE